MKILSALALLATVAIPSVTQAQFIEGAPRGWDLITQGVPVPDTIRQFSIGHDREVLVAASNGLFHSTDAGLNFTRLNSKSTSLIERGPLNKAVALAEASCYYTSDGITWKAIDAPQFKYPGASLTHFAFNTAGELFARTIGAGIFEFNESNSKWTQVIAPSKLPGVYSMTFDEHDRLLVTYDSLYRISTGFDRIERSWPVQGAFLHTNWGETIVNGPAGLFAIGDTIRKLRNYVPNLIVDSTNSLVAYNGSSSIKSTDRGATWTPFETYNAFVSEAGRDFLIGNSGPNGFTLSYDGEKTIHTLTNLDAQSNYNASVSKDGTPHLTRDDDVIFSSTDKGSTWIRSLHGFTAAPGFASDGPMYIFTGDSVGVSKDGGISYTYHSFIGKVTRSYVDSLDRVYACTADGRLLRSIDEGANWQSILGLPLSTVEVLFKGGTLYALSPRLYFSRNDGATWDSLTTPEIGGYRLYPSRTNSIYVFGYPSVTRLEIGKENNYIPSQKASSFAEEPSGRYLANSVNELVRYKDWGISVDTITHEEQGFTLDLAVDSLGNIYGTHMNVQNQPIGGAYRLNSAYNRVANDKRALSSGAEIVANELRISSEDPLVSIELYDLLGKRIAHFDASNRNQITERLPAIAAGVYLVRLHSLQGVAFARVQSE